VKRYQESFCAEWKFSIFLNADLQGTTHGGDAMPREATLFDSADGSVLKGYWLLQRGGANIPPMWIQRASQSRCRLHKDVAQALRRKSKSGQSTLKEWEKRYNKECFYYGLRVLLELARKGKTRLTKAPRA
jgi:hypothetical protein